MKKFILFALILLLNFYTVEPVLAELNKTQEENVPFFSASIEDEKVYLSPKSNYVLELESDIDVNESDVNNEVFFTLVSKVTTSNGMIRK